MSTTDAIDSGRAALVAENRRRYQALKAAGQSAQRPLPPPSPRPAPPPQGEPAASFTVPAGWYWAGRLAVGDRLRLVNVAATPGVSMMLWNALDPSERYNAPDTVKLQWTATLQRGRLLLSDMGRVLASLVEDSSGAHDTLLGGAPSPRRRDVTLDGGLRNTGDNLRLAAGKLGLTRRDLAPAVTFFAPVGTDAKGRFHWRDGGVTSGDYIELRAEMPCLVAFSNTPHPLAPVDIAAGDVTACVWAGPRPAADDICRTLSEEARRAFDNTDAFLALCR